MTNVCGEGLGDSDESALQLASGDDQTLIEYVRTTNSRILKSEFGPYKFCFKIFIKC